MKIDKENGKHEGIIASFSCWLEQETFYELKRNE
jgi:hypothetical protein